jgi:very-short-patch-repair endonuclease
VGVTYRQLRKNQTDAERKMWFILRDLDWPEAHFRRQAKIGQYFADFLSHHFKLVIEVDGSQHFELPTRGRGKRKQVCRAKPRSGRRRCLNS